jgi:AraC-like DNA-binding protein
MRHDLVQSLASYVAAHGGPDAVSTTPVREINILCSTQARLPFRKIYKPSFCIVVQGSKKIELEDRSFDYGAGTGLVVGVELPGIGSVTEATPQQPFYGLTIEFDIALMREVLEQMPKPPRPSGERLGIFVETITEPLEDCLIRLIRLFSRPEAVSVLYPSIMKELYYWLFAGPNGPEICKIARSDSHTKRIADAIYLMRDALSRPLSVEEMAAAARMGISSFHQHFKTLTSMTPLQYHKQLRLLEARRVMVAEAANVTSAAFHVGYESPSQFSREYARLFGVAPKRDAMTLRSLAASIG